MNDLLDAADSDQETEESSEDRYEKVKKEEAGNDKTEAERRYEELKEEAKEEFIQRQKERERDGEETEDENEGFITY